MAALGGTGREGRGGISPASFFSYSCRSFIISAPHFMARKTLAQISRNLISEAHGGGVGGRGGGTGRWAASRRQMMIAAAVPSGV